MLEFDAAWKAEHDKIIIMLPDVRGVGKGVLDLVSGLSRRREEGVRTLGSSGGLPLGQAGSHASRQDAKVFPFQLSFPAHHGAVERCLVGGGHGICKSTPRSQVYPWGSQQRWRGASLVWGEALGT